MGRAMSEGGVGDTVTVQNPASFRMISAIVTGPGTVRATGAIRSQPVPPHRSRARAIRIRPCVTSSKISAPCWPARALRPVRRWTASRISARRPSWRRWAIPPASQIVAEIPRPPPITHADNSLWQPGAQSFFHDPRASHVGDVITVNVSVADAAKLQNTTSRSRTNTDDASLTNFFGLEKALPSSIDPTSLVKMGSDNSNVGTGSVDRSGIHQHDPGGAGRPGAAQRQSGDRRPSAGAREQRAARPAACRRHRAHAKTSPAPTRSISPRSPRRASPMAATARSATCSSRATARSCSTS